MSQRPSLPPPSFASPVSFNLSQLAQTYCIATKVMSALEVAAGSHGVVETNSKLYGSGVSDFVSHSNNVVNMSTDDLCLL